MANHKTTVVAGFFAALLLPALAGAQYLQIPDFRDPPPRPAANRPLETCATCGTITAIRETRTRRPAAVPQGFRNDPMSSGSQDSTFRVGAVVALPLSENSADQPFVGGVGTPEMRERFSESDYEITVRMDNGAYSVAQRRDGGRFRVGDRVRVQGVNFELIGR